MMLKTALLAAAILGGQALFDVVSIKPAGPGAPPLVIGPSIMSVRNGRLRAPGMTAMGLITRAFGTQPAMVIGAPDWVSTTQYEIVVTMGGNRSDADVLAPLPSVLRSVLDVRFALKAHAERRPFPVYVLVKARRDGRLGPQFRPSVTDCPAAPRAMDLPRPALAPSAERTCFGGIFRAGTIQSGNISMDDLARRLTNFGGTDRVVLDRTGLEGKFDIDLQWALDQSAEGPSLFTAVQEQLALKLEPRSEPLDAIVIDHIERPEPN